MLVDTKQQTGVKWWVPGRRSDEDFERNRAAALHTETASIEQYQRQWHELNLWNATLYSNRSLVGFQWGVVGESAKEMWPVNLNTENLVEEIGDSMLSRASSSPLRPSLVPHGNSWKVERAVRVADQFVFATWKQTNSEDACVRAFLDSYISSVGCVKDEYDEDTNTLSCQPVFFDNIIIDNRECLNRQQPRTVRIRQVIPTASIRAKYPKAKFDEKKSPYVSYRQHGEGYSILIEAWRLPDDEGKDGRHVLVCDGALLVDEEWDVPWFPLEFFHWGEVLSGFFMRSGVEQVVPYQLRQNDLNDAITEAQDIACRPRMKIHAAAQIDLSQWDNEAGRFVGWSGSEPEPLVWPTNLQELYAERERNRQKAYGGVGQSEMFGTMDLPPQVRLDSSAGVREMHNMEDRRHLRKWGRFEDFRLRVARMHMRVLGRHEGAAAYTAVYHPARLRAAARRITFEAIKTLNEDQFSWTLEATPLSQQSPAARRETLRDWVSRGLIDDAQAKRMLTNPNLEREEELELSSIDDIGRHIEVMEEGDYEPPTELTNLTYGIKKVSANYHRLRRYDEAKKRDPELLEILQNHIRWITRAVSIQQMAVQPAQPVAFQPTQGMPGTSAAQMPQAMGA